jgi:hypothetical protein
MYIITSGITFLVLTAYRMYTVFESRVNPCCSVNWLRVLVAGLSPLCPLRMGLFWTDGALGQVYCGQRGAETGFSPKTFSALACQYPITA